MVNSYMNYISTASELKEVRRKEPRRGTPPRGYSEQRGNTTGSNSGSSTGHCAVPATVPGNGERDVTADATLSEPVALDLPRCCQESRVGLWLCRNRDSYSVLTFLEENAFVLRK